MVTIKSVHLKWRLCIQWLCWHCVYNQRFWCGWVFTVLPVRGYVWECGPHLCRLQCWEWMSCHCRWLQQAVKPLWDCVRCRCSPEMLAVCWCSTTGNSQWRDLNTCFYSTSMCRCRHLPMVTQASSLCCLLCLMWLHSVVKAIVNNLFHWHRDFKVKYNNSSNNNNNNN